VLRWRPRAFACWKVNSYTGNEFIAGAMSVKKPLSSSETTSKMGWQMKIYMLILIFSVFFFAYISLEFKTFWAIPFIVLYFILIPFFALYSVSFDDKQIKMKRFAGYAVRSYDEITSVSITAAYGKFVIPGVPGFMITLGNKSWFKILNVSFVGQKHAHYLTRMFLNAVIAKNPSVEICDSIIRSYGKPPYVINQRIIDELKT
jgi:energy-coupling factor transporter transmembrane protein EcfT